MRRALHEFLAWYLPRLPKQALSPYLGLLQLQISSALSHIFPAIRIDACKLVELLLETHPADVVGNWPASDPSSSTSSPVSAIPTSGSTIFDGLRLSAGLGEEKGASTQAGFRLTPATKLVILRTIKTFVVKALESTAQPGISPKRAAKAKLGEWTLTELNALPSDQWSLQTSSVWGVECEFDGGEKIRSVDLAVGNGAVEELTVSLTSQYCANLKENVPCSPLPPPFDVHGVGSLCVPSLFCIDLSDNRRGIPESLLSLHRACVGLCPHLFRVFRLWLAARRCRVKVVVFRLCQAHVRLVPIQQGVACRHGRQCYHVRTFASLCQAGGCPGAQGAGDYAGAPQRRLAVPRARD